MEKALVMIAALRASQTHPLLSQAYSTVIECDHANTSTGVNASVDPDQETLPTMASEVKMGWGMPPAKLQDLSRPEEQDKDRGLFSSMTILLSLRVAKKWNMELIMYETDAWSEFKVLAGELGVSRTKDRSAANFFASPPTMTQLLDLLTRKNTVLVLCDTRVVEELYFSRRSFAFDLLLPPPGESVPSHVIVTNFAPGGRPAYNPLSAMAYFYHRISCCAVGKHCVGCDRLLKTLDYYCNL